jgi:uncharacterized Zn finger protein
MTRETVQGKGERYLISGRLTVHLATPESFTAFVKGDTGHQYEVIHDADFWHCTCPAHGRCAHLIAAMRVTALPGTAVLR